MKIVLIVGNKDGGLVHYTSQLANALREVYDVIVIAPEGINREYFNNQTFIQLIDHLTIGKLLHKEILSVSDLVRTIQTINPDVIHILSPHPAICFGIPFLRKYPKIITIHNPITLQTIRHLLLLLSDNVINMVYMRYADILIVHGKKLKEILSKKVAKEKIKIIPHGDYSFFTKWEKGYVEENKSVLFFGFIGDQKGIRYLIKAEPLITEKIPDAKIVIAGKGDFKKYEKEIKNKSHFEIHNETIPNEQVAEFFQRACVVVLPYIKASQSGIIPIAYAFKKPVVVTNVGSIPEVVEDGVTGYIVPPKNPEALADAVIKLLKDDKLRKQMAENAYKKMKEDLSWDIIAEKTIEIYKEAISGKTCK